MVPIPISLSSLYSTLICFIVPNTTWSYIIYFLTPGLLSLTENYYDEKDFFVFTAVTLASRPVSLHGGPSVHDLQSTSFKCIQ